MIYFVANEIGSDCATREGFQCPQCEVLVEVTKWRALHHLATAHLITERKWYYMRTSRVYMTSKGFERVAGEGAMISVSFVNLRRKRLFRSLSWPIVGILSPVFSMQIVFC